MRDSVELQEWMRERGISQTILVKRLQCTRSTILRILNGRGLKVRINELMKEDVTTIAAVVPDAMGAIRSSSQRTRA